MLGRWLPFPPQDASAIPERPGVYVLADQARQILAIAAALNLREALEDLAAAPPLPLRDLATRFCAEEDPEPNRRRAELIANLRARTGAFPPCNRRYPRFPARLAAWTRHPTPRAGQPQAPAETLNVSRAGLMLALSEAPPPGTLLSLEVETPFGVVQGEGRLAWIATNPDGVCGGVTLRRLRTAQDALRWERLVGSLTDLVVHD
jgi:hypothetical protein